MNSERAYTSVWDAIAETPEQSAILGVRAELMQKVVALIRAREWDLAEAASHCRVTVPRMDELLTGRLSRFSLDSLVSIATAVGCRVKFSLQGGSDGPGSA